MLKKSLARIAIKVTRRFWPPSLLQSWDKLSNWSNLWVFHRFASLQIGWLSATQQCDWLLSAVDSFAYWKKLNGEACPGRCKPLAACEVFFQLQTKLWNHGRRHRRKKTRGLQLFSSSCCKRPKFVDVCCSVGRLGLRPSAPLSGSLPMSVLHRRYSPYLTLLSSLGCHSEARSSMRVSSTMTSSYLSLKSRLARVPGLGVTGGLFTIE